jgi:indolepyruvate ferredoxin oxidoreductase
VKGDCPSFITVVPGEQKPQGAIPELPQLPEPERIVGDRDFTVRMIGIGGTGVVTVSQVLAMAAHLEGKHTWGLDQTGLSQKGGPVISDVRIATEPIAGANKVSAGRVDLYLGFDLLESANPKNLRSADPERTVAVVSTGMVPTGKMVTDVEAPTQFPALSTALDAIGRATRADRNVYMDAQALSQRLFADHMPANVVALGAAYRMRHGVRWHVDHSRWPEVAQRLRPADLSAGVARRATTGRDGGGLARRRRHPRNAGAPPTTCRRVRDGDARRRQYRGAAATPR